MRALHLTLTDELLADLSPDKDGMGQRCWCVMPGVLSAGKLGVLFQASLPFMFSMSCMVMTLGHQDSAACVRLIICACRGVQGVQRAHDLQHAAGVGCLGPPRLLAAHRHPIPLVGSACLPGLGFRVQSIILLSDQAKQQQHIYVLDGPRAAWKCKTEWQLSCRPYQHRQSACLLDPADKA